MSVHAFASPLYSRLDPALARQLPAADARPTKTQSAVEWTLFAVFGVSIILCAIALYSIYSPGHRQVPNSFGAGLRSGRVNVLVIGTSRTGRSTSTESLTLVSLRPETGQAALIAIPRDLWVPISHYGTHRLASALNIGDSSGYPGEGPGLVNDTVQHVIGQPVHAYVQLDNGGLRAAVDTVGGIDIVVPHPFYEYRHRDRFIAGPTHLDGERAIRYAQSSAVVGPQGARFARELRQQQVISAVVQKIATEPPDVRARLAGITSGSNNTNLTAAQIDGLCDAIQTARLQQVTLAPLVTEFEVRSLMDGGQAMRPRSGDFGKVQELARSVFAGAQPIAAVR